MAKDEALFGTRKDEPQQVICKLLLAATDDPKVFRESVDGAKYGWPLTLQNDIYFRLLTALSRGRVDRIDAQLILSAMKENGAGDLEEFNRRFDEYVVRQKVIFENSPEWRFFVPLSIQLDFGTPLPINFEVLGKTLAIDDWATAVADIPADKLAIAMALAGLKEDDLAKHCLVGKARAPHLEWAWSELSPAFEGWRGMLELVHGFGRTQISLFPKARSLLSHPAWLLGWNERDEQALATKFVLFKAVEDIKSQSVHLSQGDFALLRDKLLEWLPASPSPNDLKTLFADALRVYLQALDAHENHFAFLGMWQCMEAVAMVGEDEKGSGQKAVARIAAILDRLNADTAHIGLVLNDLYRKRNAIVHSGRHDVVSRADVAFAKKCCDYVLWALIELHAKLPTKAHLKQFYEHASINDQAFRAVLEALQFIQSDRQAESPGK